MSEMAERAIEYTFKELEENDSNLAKEIIKGTGMWMIWNGKEYAAFVIGKARIV